MLLGRSTSDASTRAERRTVDRSTKAARKSLCNAAWVRVDDAPGSAGGASPPLLLSDGSPSARAHAASMMAKNMVRDMSDHSAFADPAGLLGVFAAERYRTA